RPGSQDPPGSHREPENHEYPGKRKDGPVRQKSRKGQTMKIIDQERPNSDMDGEPHEAGFLQPTPPPSAAARRPASLAENRRAACAPVPQGEDGQNAQRRAERKLKTRSQKRLRFRQEDPARRQKQPIV